MRNNPVPFYSTFQPSLSYRLRHSRLLKVSVALLGVLILVLAALVVNREPALLFFRSGLQVA